MFAGPKMLVNTIFLNTKQQLIHIISILDGNLEEDSRNLITYTSIYTYIYMHNIYIQTCTHLNAHPYFNNSILNKHLRCNIWTAKYIDFISMINSNLCQTRVNLSIDSRSLFFNFEKNKSKNKIVFSDSFRQLFQKIDVLCRYYWKLQFVISVEYHHVRFVYEKIDIQFFMR